MNSRNGFWGKGAIDAISASLEKELPGLRGFSARNLRNMRTFYEEWAILDYTATATEKIDNQVLADISAKSPKKDALQIWHMHVPNSDSTKPIGVATYKTYKDMSEELKKALPPIYALKKLLDEEDMDEV